MASYLYRPTPVVNLGKGEFASKHYFSPSGLMRGILLGWNYGPGLGRIRAAHTPAEPYIHRSGTMGQFLPHGLGQDDSLDISLPTDLSSSLVNLSPTADLPSPIDTSTIFDTSALVAPSSSPLPTPLFLTSGITPQQTSMSPIGTTLTPLAQTGPTGTGIPGTQPLQLQPSQPASLISSIGSAISSFFKPTTAVPAAYTTLPGYGGTAAVAASIIPGVANTTLLIGVAAIALVAVMAGGKK